MKYLYRILLAAVALIIIYAGLESCKRRHVSAKGPKLVVGIVVDQMRWDYLYRYASKYSQGGFKRLMHEGYSCENTHIDYLPTYTAPGHACIYTGSVPAIHGIVGNSWYERRLDNEITSVTDPSVKMVGEGTAKGKSVSPINLLTTTITDELRLATNKHSKVISLALKDRSAVLPGGHTANAAYFLDAGTGNFVTTSYYMSQLPGWVDSFNNKKLAKKYLDENWATILPIAAYAESTDDDEPFEKAYKGENKPVFPHQTKELSKDNPDLIATTAFGNSLTLDFAEAAIEGEKLGRNTVTDFLAISLSSTDLVGHQFGPNSVEVEDCYLRLDKDLATFFSFLDQKLGKDNYLVFLTADHGVAQVPAYMQQEKIPAGSFEINYAIGLLNSMLATKFEKNDTVISHQNMQLYFDSAAFLSAKTTREQIFNATRNFLIKFDAIADVIDLKNIASATLQFEEKNMIVNGYYPKRSGDFQILYNPAWIEEYTKGAQHGTLYPYDTHIPLIWMGWKIKHGQNHESIHMTDIAPTIAAFLNIQEPSGCIGKPIKQLVDKK
jgi:predicted AlkP superfamily pyrophosphatase or phosphodiesterase